MGSKYSKLIEEVERAERKRDEIMKIQERETLKTHREWERMQGNIMKLQKQVKESRETNVVLIKTMKELWENIQNQAAWLEAEELKRLEKLNHCHETYP